jgi:cytoskeletal protein CcmA (bactofilin family)
MFTKTPEDAATPELPPTRLQVASQRSRPAPRGSGSDAATVIGAGLSVTGNLESKGEVHVEGEVQGDVHAQHIVIGDRARIKGGLIAEEIVVRGNVQGSIRGNAVTFHSSSRVEGDVFHKSLVIEQGAFFEGKSRRSEDPTSVQSTASGLPPAAA